MTRYADPGRCPDCGAPILPGAAACAACGLPLLGEDAARLFGTLAQADLLLARLRAGSAPPPPSVATTPVTGRPPDAGQNSLIAGRGLPAVSVPRILLGLGAGCLLVAALVFLAVTWSVLGVGGRTAVLVCLTAVAGAVAAEMSRRRLRAAAESLALVGYGLLTLDLIGANHAGWFGRLSAAGLLALLGCTLAIAGVGGALAARRGGRVLSAGEAAAATGTGLLALAVAVAQWLPAAPSGALATLLALSAAAAADRLRLRLAVLGSVLVAVLCWLVLSGEAVQRVLDRGGSWHELWGAFRVWPMLAAAGFAALPALARRLPVAVRVGGPAIALLMITVAALYPATALSGTPATLVGIGVLAAAAPVAALLPRPWGLTAVLTQAVAVAGVAVVAAVLATDAVERLADAADPALAGAGTDLLPAHGGDLAAWLLPLCALAVLVSAWTLARAVGAVGGRVDPDLVPWAVPVAPTAAALVLALSLYPVPLLLVVAATLLLAAGFTGAWLSVGDGVLLAVGAVLAAAALAVSLHAESLLAASLVVVLAGTVLVHLRAAATALAAAAGAVLAGSTAGEVGTLADLAGVPEPWAALLALVALGVLVLGAPFLPDRWWQARADDARLGGEAGAAVAAAVTAVAGAGEATRGATWAAVYLTVVGVVVTLMSLLRPGRRRLAWAGGALLAVASWVRLADLGVRAPEAYTLPSAVVLIAAGVVRLRRTRSADTVQALGPGLGLALVPSLLWLLLDDVTGLRALLLGLGCLALVLAGARLGWTAPLVAGAGAGAVLVLRLAGPYLGAAVPRWVLIGLAGALLLGLGATWEHRLRDARRVHAYLGGLR